MKRIVGLIVGLIGLVGVVSPVMAHPMPSSNVNLMIKEAQINGEVTMPLIEFETVIGKQFQQADKSEYISYFKKHISAHTGESSRETQITNIYTQTSNDPIIGNYDQIIVDFILKPDLQLYVRDFNFDYDAIIHQVVTHQALVYIKQDRQNGIHDEDSSHNQIGTIQVDVPTGKINPLHISLDQGGAWKGFVGMVMLGIKHIQGGLDHILFLLTLLLISPLIIIGQRRSLGQGTRYTLKRFLSISLAFTIGHSITLLVGSFDIISIPTKYIEIAIAITILVSAINCIRPIFNNKEVVIAVLFGLIHGMAFSFSISSLGLDTNLKLLSIVGFNIGIEIMQIAIMIVFSPILLLSRYNIYDYMRIIFAVVVGVLAIGWIVNYL